MPGPFASLLSMATAGSHKVLGTELPTDAYGWAVLLLGLILFFEAIALGAGAFADEHAPPRPSRADGSARTYRGFAQSLVLPIGLLTWGLALCIAHPLPTTPIFLCAVAAGLWLWRRLRQQNP